MEGPLTCDDHWTMLESGRFSADYRKRLLLCWTAFIGWLAQESYSMTDMIGDPTGFEKFPCVYLNVL